MGRAKEIIVKVIPAKIANEFVKKHHYSGKVVQNSTLHFGYFLDGKLHGVMSYGYPTVKKNVIELVEDTNWNGFLELNRMAFDYYLPKNSESRCLSISFKMIKKQAPHIKWILSYSDAAQCGDGAIYRASGFKLTGIKKNTAIGVMPQGETVNRVTLGINKYTPYLNRLVRKYNVNKTEGVLDRWRNAGMKWIDGYQLRYIYLIDKSCKITVPILPFSKIDEMGAGMYKGEKITLAERRDNNAVEAQEKCV